MSTHNYVTVHRKLQVSNLSSTLNMLIKARDLNPSELARLTGIGQPVIYRILSGETSNPKTDTLKTIADFFSVSINFLLGDPIHQSEININKRYKDIPLIEWNEIECWQETNEMSNSQKILTEAKISNGAYALKVKDSTMMPRFSEDTILIVDPSLTPKNRDYAIILHGKQNIPIFRQILFDCNKVYAKPLNPAFKMILLKKPYKFLGVVVEAKINLSGEIFNEI